MDAAEFVGNLRLGVEATAVRGILNHLQRPPGRDPDRVLVEVSRWFNALSAADREMVRAVVEMTAEQTTYNVLLVLDGHAAIESGPAKGELEVSYVQDGNRRRLNDPAGRELTALFKETGRPPHDAEPV